MKCEGHERRGEDVETVVAYLKVLSQNSLAETEANNAKSLP